MKNKKSTGTKKAFEPAEKILEEMHVPFVETDADGVILRANQCALALYSEEMGGLAGKFVWELMAPEEREISRRSFHLALKSGEDPLPVHRSILTGEGQYRVFEIHRYLSRDENGTPSGMCNVSFDVTETVQAKEEERNAREWSEMLIESLPDAVVSVDVLGMILSANRAAETLTGWADGTLIGKIVENAISVERYASPDCTSLSHSISLARPTRGLATIVNLRREEVDVEIRTLPMRDKYTGVIKGIVIVLRSQKDLG